MQNQHLENHIEFLLSAALQRCGNIYDAEDLTQETLLAALSYLAKGKSIQDMRAWLLVVMGRKFNDMLRKKYRQATLLVNDAPETMDKSASTAFAARRMRPSRSAGPLPIWPGPTVRSSFGTT